MVEPFGQNPRPPPPPKPPPDDPPPLNPDPPELRGAEVIVEPVRDAMLLMRLVKPRALNWARSLPWYQAGAVITMDSNARAQFVSTPSAIA